jgi:hypothetical protein
LNKKNTMDESIQPQVVVIEKGPKGDTGEQGPKGNTGNTGAQGPKGDTGDFGRYAACYTAEGAPEKAVSVANFSKVSGATLLVRFFNGNTAASPTLNVSGTGAHAMAFHGSTIGSGVIKAGDTYLFVFDGAYQMVGESDYTYSAANAALATANQAASTANNIAGTANDAKTTASQAASTANDAKTIANGIAGTANDAKTIANQAASTANDAKAIANQAASTAYSAASFANAADGKASAALASLSSPTGMELSYPASVSVRNAALQRIEARLLPAFTKQDCAIFLPAGGDAIDLYPDGTFRVQQLGTSRVYVVPTLAASAYKAVDITVRPAYMRRTGSGGIRLTGAGKPRIF